MLAVRTLVRTRHLPTEPMDSETFLMTCVPAGSLGSSKEEGPSHGSQVAGQRGGRPPAFDSNGYKNRNVLERPFACR